MYVPGQVPVVQRDASVSYSADQSRDVLAALRNATAELHARVEAAMPLTASNAELNAYRAHLALLRAWLHPLQSQLATFSDGPQRPGLLPVIDRVAQLDDDLTQLQATAADAQSEQSLSCAASPAYRWGVCYVIEGSQLGNAVLYRLCRDRLDALPVRYLANDGTPPGPRWRQFTDGLCAEVIAPGAIEQACAGACATFERLMALLHRPSPAQGVA